MIAVIVLLAVVGGGAYYYIKFVRGKKQKDDDLDFYDDDGYEDGPYVNEDDDRERILPTMMRTRKRTSNGNCPPQIKLAAGSHINSIRLRSGNPGYSVFDPVPAHVDLIHCDDVFRKIVPYEIVNTKLP